MRLDAEGRDAESGLRLSQTERETRVEALTMALYLAIVLLAESIALRAYSANSVEILATRTRNSSVPSFLGFASCASVAAA